MSERLQSIFKVSILLKHDYVMETFLDVVPNAVLNQPQILKIYPQQIAPPFATDENNATGGK